MTRNNNEYTILLVEDEPFIALDAAAEIEDSGFRCHVAYTLESALDIVKSTEVDAALLDYDLGGVTSLPLAQQLNSTGRPFAFVTGREKSEITGQMGENIFVFTKPANYVQIAGVLID